MRIQTVVQHAGEARGHLLPRLLAALPEGATVVTDPDTDDLRRSPWRTYLACLRTLEPDATHLLVIQDDAEPCLNFGRAVDLIVRSRPNVPLVLFCPGLGQQRRAILDACRAGERYARLPTANTFVPAVAVVWPRDSVASILAYAERAPEMTADDGHLGRWAAETGAEILATVPSLVEHPDVERSLVGRHAMSGRNPGRIAACWVGDLDPLTLDGW